MQDLKQGKVIFPGEKLSFLKTAKPSTAMSEYVTCYYEVQLNNIEETVASHTSLPTLNSLICINLDGPGWGYITKKGDEKLIRSSIFIGHTPDTRNNFHPRGMRNFFVALKPGLASLLLRSRPKEITNTEIDLSYLFKGLFLEEKLCEAESFQQRIQLFEEAFYPMISCHHENYKYQIVQNGLEVLGKQQSVNKQCLEGICRDLAVSYSSLYRYFKEITGYSPKYCQLVEKFRMGLEQYKRNGYNFNHWEYGFADFSHFVKVSKQLTDRPPSGLMQ